ncbi:TRAP transporter small permease [Martelella soudanensis]|uniref:TRAP transporter small permease n=1 Tax=unclassified Martelella TaxID=2629616 RepID=UPI0015DDC3D3|nr:MULTISPECIES: TRAP transporter small permease [unclassified Martelella]
MTTGNKTFRRAEQALLALAAVTILFMMTLTAVDVVGRYFLSSPVAGAFELTEFAMAIAIFAALPVVTLRKAQVTADLVSGTLGRLGTHVLGFVTDLAGLVLFSLLCWRLWIEGIEVAHYGTTAGILHLPLAPLAFYASALSGLSALVHVSHLVTRMRGQA